MYESPLMTCLDDGTMIPSFNDFAMISDLFNEMTEYAESLKERIKELEACINEAGPGNLRIRKRPNGSVLYYVEQCTNGVRRTTYLTKEDSEELEKYAKKKYAREVLPTVRQNLLACDEFFAEHSRNEEGFLADELDDELLDLVPELEQAIERHCREWESRPYESHNPVHPEDLKHKTLKGDLVRSKSEAIIADTLYRADVPYLYEFPLQLLSTSYPIYPDFTILDKKTGMNVYWEHFGRMDDPGYSANAVERINRYENEGIALSIDLITTFETLADPLPARAVSQIVEHRFK